MSGATIHLTSADKMKKKSNEISFRPRPVKELISESYKSKRNSIDVENSRCKSNSIDQSCLDSGNAGNQLNSSTILFEIDRSKYVLKSLSGMK